MRIDEKTYKAMPAHLQALFRAEPNPARDEVLAAFPNAPGQQGALTGDERRKAQVYGKFAGVAAHQPRGDAGSAARFFYCAKASKSDRGADNVHPTVKPTELMRYLCRLVTPPGGVVLDPFMGSGSTGRGAVLEGFRFVGIECEEEYVAIARARIEHVERTLSQPEPPATMDLFSWEAA